MGTETDVKDNKSGSRSDDSLGGGQALDDNQTGVDYWKNKAHELERKSSDRQALLDAEVKKSQSLGTELDETRAKLPTDEDLAAAAAGNGNGDGTGEDIDGKITTSSAKTLDEADQRVEVKLVDDFVLDKATEENIDPKVLREELEMYAVRHQNKPPRLRVKEAFKDRAEYKKYLGEKTQFEKDRTAEGNYVEEGGGFGGPSSASVPANSVEEMKTATKEQWIDILSKFPDQETG